MIVKIKEYSGKTGKGKAIDPAGKQIPFTYKEFKDEKSIPIGGTAEFIDGIYSAAKVNKTFLFNLYKLFIFIKGKLWR